MRVAFELESLELGTTAGSLGMQLPLDALQPVINLMNRQRVSFYFLNIVIKIDN